LTEQAAHPVEVTFTHRYLSRLQRAGLGDYASIMAHRAGQSLAKPGLGGRERIRLALPTGDGADETIYLKRYPTGEPAQREWAALEAVRDAEVPTMGPLAMGTGPAGGFIIVTAVPGEALLRCMDDLLRRRGTDPAAMTALATELGHLIGSLHAAGLAHRDFYTAHVFLHERVEAMDLYLIDLARVFRPRRRRWRWWAKDLAQLKFSLPHRFSEPYWPEVWAAYVRKRGLQPPRRMGGIIDRRVRAMQRQAVRRLAAGDRKKGA